MVSLKVKLAAVGAVCLVFLVLGLYAYVALVPHSTTVTVTYGQSAQSTGLLQQQGGKPVLP